MEATETWNDMIKQWSSMQSGLYNQWMEGLKRVQKQTGMTVKIPEMSNTNEMYQQWIQTLNDLLAKFPISAHGPGAETFQKLFSSADVYMHLYGWWNDLYRQFQENIGDADGVDFVKMLEKMKEVSGYDDIIEKVFSSAMPDSLRWIAELYQGEIPRIGAEMDTRMIMPWVSFNQSIINRLKSGERLTPEMIASVYDDWRKAYEESLGRLMHVPALGYYRETIEKYTAALDSMVEFNLVLADFYASLNAAGNKAMEKLQQGLSEALAAGEGTPQSFRDIYDLWWKTNEDVYIELFRTEEFSRLMGQLVEKGMYFKASFQAFMEEATKDLPFPNRTEMDTLYKTVYKLKREVRIQRKEIEELREMLGGKEQ